MSESSILNQERFWKVLKFLAELDVGKSSHQICEELSISKWELNSFLNFMSEVGYQFSIDISSGEDKMIIPPEDKPNFVLEFSFLEWIQFQAHFPKLAECSDEPFHGEFRDKLSDAEDRYSDFDIFSPLMTLDNIFKQHEPSLVEEVSNPAKEILLFIEEAIIDRALVSVSCHGKNLKLFPHKIVYFDGGLNLLAEDMVDKCLVNVSLNEIENAYEENGEYSPQYSKFEVEEFVRSIRSMSENQIRLVLKIYLREKFRLNFDQKYFDNACLFTNPDGDFIWAATLEPSEEVYEWLCELGNAVEILDPVQFKEDFIKYCELKLKKLA